MASRDYLIRQVEEMGIFLAMLLRRILKMKEERQQDLISLVVREELLKETNLELDQLVVMSDRDFFEVVHSKFTSDDQLEKLADILRVLGLEIEHSLSVTRANYVLKSLFLFKYLQAKSANYSYERRTKILELEELTLRSGLIGNVDY
jgi:hypothetical protein